MELALIFAIGWVASHTFGEKRDEYERSQDAHRDKYMRRLAAKHPNWSQARQARYLQNAARRNSLGHFAYLLRHGWSSTFNDFVHGWSKAKDAHEEWKAGRPEKAKKPGLFAMLKAGWKDQSSRRPKATGYYEARPDLTPESEPENTPRPEPKQDRTLEEDTALLATMERGLQETIAAFEKNGDDLTDEDIAEHMENRRRREAQINKLRQILGLPAYGTTGGAKVLPITGKTAKTPGNTAGSTNGRTAVEYNLDASKAAVAKMGQFGISQTSVVEQIIADAIAGELHSDPDAMSHLASLQEALSNLTAHASAFVDSLNKHAQGQEYANTGHAAATGYLKSN